MQISKSLTVFALVAVVLAEPPVNYSTTQQDVFAPPAPNAPSASYGVPSNAYGPPTGSRFSTNRQTTAVLRPSSNYGAPPATAFDPPSGLGVKRGSTTYTGSNTFGGSSTFGGSTSFGGSTNFGGGSTNFGGSGYVNRGNFRRPSSSYGVPSAGFDEYTGGYDDGSSAPASYKFSYHVQDAASGNDYGHQESREGLVATGMYMVLLPDGRRQIVEYTADETGYHPNVRYEGTAIAGGYPGTPAGGYRY